MSKLWGGRFSKGTHKLVEEYTKSIHFDQKLAIYDCLGSLIHIQILKKARLLSSREHKKLSDGLKKVIASIQDGSFKINLSFEDIHSYIQYLLEKEVGETAFKLHTCRSRNDQVLFDTKCYCLDNILVTRDLIQSVNRNLVKLAQKNFDIYMPGYTHLQHAIPVALSDYLMAYYEMFNRDFKRLTTSYDHIPLTMGSGALAGTFIDSSNYFSSIKLPKSGEKISIQPATNSLDAVSDRDFIIEILSVLSIVGIHLSRLAEDFILWTTREFDFLDIDETFCTGSSLMPQKKNPDILELMRGYSGKLSGNLITMLTIMKGLPLTYNRDMQLDKESLFESFDIVQDSLEIVSELLQNVRFKKDNIKKQLNDECLYATDIADYLVKQGVPFKKAHTIVGKLIAFKLAKGKDLLEMNDNELKQFHPTLNPGILRKIINPKFSIQSKKSTRRQTRRK